MSRIFYIMGKSASGKDTVYRRILEECREIQPVVLYTTRPVRSGETEGKEYHFITRERMDQYQDEGKIIEIRTYQTVVGPWSYATIDDGTIESFGNYLGIGTLESYKKMRQYYGEEVMVPIYIKVEDGVRLERALIRERGQKNPNYAELCRRYLADEIDFSDENLKEAGITEVYENHDLEECINAVLNKIAMHSIESVI